MTKNINKPYRYENKWLVFPDTTFNKLDILDCDDTTRGMCIENVSLEDCIKECEKFSQYCTFGYYVKTNNNRTLCAPLRTELYPNLNPLSIMANKNTYSEFSDTNVNTFMNTQVHPFPRNQANTVFYKDIMNLINVETNTSIDADVVQIQDGSSILFTKGNRLNITFFPIDKNALNIAPYVPVMYGDLININVSNSALVMKKNDTAEDIIWSQSLGITTEDFAFRILPISRGKIGEPVAYGDKFCFTYATDGFYVVVDSNVGNILSLHSGDYDRILSMGQYFPTFTLESKMVAYYCENGECKSVPVSKLDINGVSGMYNNTIATRLKGCVGMCEYAPNGVFSLFELPSNNIKSEKSKVLNTVAIVIALIVIAAIIMVIIRQIATYRVDR